MRAITDHPGVVFDVRIAESRQSQRQMGATARRCHARAVLTFCLWAASLASVGMIIGSVSRWATAFGFISVSGIDMYSSNEAAIAIVGLTMVGTHSLGGWSMPLLVAALGGVLGAIQAGVTLDKIGSDGAKSVLGMNYRFLHPAWGLYLVLVSAIFLAFSAALAWYAARAIAPSGR